MSARYDAHLGLNQLKPRRWYDTTAGARFGLAAAIGISLLLLAAITRAVWA